MSFKIVTADSFVRGRKPLAKRFKSMKEDLRRLRAEIEANPQGGEPLGRACYKVRPALAAKGKGKGGGARGIACVKIVGETAYLPTIYDKSAQESISDQDRGALLRENGLV